jgi:hypothetical protein
MAEYDSDEIYELLSMNDWYEKIDFYLHGFVFIGYGNGKQQRRSETMPQGYQK